MHGRPLGNCVDRQTSDGTEQLFVFNYLVDHLWNCFVVEC
jgi:hypothetical protein